MNGHQRESWVKVFTGSPTDAEMARGVLEGSAITSVVTRLGGGAYGLDPGPLGETTVSVQVADVAAALEVLGSDAAVEPGADPSYEDDRPPSFVRSAGIWVGRVAVFLVIATLLFEAVQR